MLTNISSSAGRKTLALLALMLAGRAMTVAFIGRAGGVGPGDPPAAWLMPLIGDAVVGLSALVIVYLALKGRGVFAWTFIVIWNVVAIWDALSAFLIHTTVPWPSFFMIQIFGASMFFVASALHAVCLVIVSTPHVRDSFLRVDREPLPA